MKKVFALIFALFMVFSMAMSACAVSAQLNSTKAFLATLDENDIKYTVVGLDDDGDEQITVSNKDDNGFEYTFNLFFDSDEENCYIRVWNIIHYSDADFSKVLRTCNSLNDKYNFLRFTADESDNMVTAAIDLIYRDNDVGEIVLEALMASARILEAAYPDLSVYAQ